MDDARARKIMALALRAGEVLLSNSVSVADVVTSLDRMTTALGLEGCSIVVELNTVTISYLLPDLSGSGTVVRVVDMRKPHVHRLVDVQRLVDRIERNEVTLDEAWDALDEIEASPGPYTTFWRFVADLVSVAAWVVFAGGDVISVLSAVVATLGVRGAFELVGRTRVPPIFATVASAFVIVAVPYGLAWTGVGFRVSPAVVGALYQLLPGAALVASVSDGLSGSLQTSVARGVQAMVTAIGVALGVLAGLSASDALGIELPEVPAGPWSPPVTAVAAALAVGFLAVARRVPFEYVGAVTCLAGGVWAVAYLGPANGVGADVTTALAALVLGLGGRMVSRLQHSVSTIYTSTAVLVLVPGTTIYLAMLAFAREANEAGLTLTIDALTTSLAIAVGTTIGVALGGSVPRPPSPLRLVPMGRIMLRLDGEPRARPGGGKEDRGRSGT